VRREPGLGTRDSGLGFRFAVLPLFLAAAAAVAQTTGAQVLKQPKPVYPENASKGLKQGNVNLIGRIDTKGKVQDIRFVDATLDAFVEPAVAAVNAWEFRPAIRGGKPVEISANIAVRFRLEGEKHGEITSPMLGDLAIYPADASGKGKAPEGFPIRRGADPRFRVEAVLDVSPDPKPRKVNVTVEAISPKGRRVLIHEELVSVNPKAAQVKIPFTPAVGADWEDGVWLVRFQVDAKDAGGGQFWLAGDPDHYQFVLPGKEQPPPTSQSAAPPGGKSKAPPRAPTPAAKSKK
jgi:TonB family protein